MNLDVLPRPSLTPDVKADDPRPVVRLPSSGMPGFVIAIVAAIAAVLLFLILDGQRRSSVPDSGWPDQTQSGTFSSPPPLALPPEPAPQQAPVLTIPVQMQPQPAPVRVPRTIVSAPEPMPMVPMNQPFVPPLPAAPATAPTAPVSELTEPALIYDNGTPERPAVKAPLETAQEAPPPGGAPRRGTSVAQPAIRPGRIANPGMVVPTGTLIKAVLETPIDTSRPGFARAIVSADARSFDGHRVLVPRGSRLIGEYESDVRTGQKKVLVNWTQLVRPDGSTIRLDSPAADAMGGAGVPGKVNTFFFQRFFNAVLQSALTIGGSLATWSSDAPVVVGLSQNAVTNVTGQAGLVGQAPQPKITVKQGTAFNVFVARDLDFSGAPLRR